jgi:hypothetical protein
MNPSLTPLFRAIRRRLRVAWALTTLQLSAPLVALGALALVLAGRFFDIAWAEPAALLLVAAVVAVVTGYALVCRVPDLLVARAADRGLRTRDAFATSLELAGHDDDFADRVRHRAQELAGVAEPKEAVHYRLLRKPTGIAALIAPAALVLAFIANPQDALRERRANDAAAIEATADVVEAEAQRIAELPGGQDAAERLQQLADELSNTDSLEMADELLQEAEAELRNEVGTDTLATTAATEGLQRSLENSPLPGASSEQSVQQQLDALAGELPGMSDSERSDAAERLEALAATQEAGDPATADLLREAAQAIRDGDIATTQARLGEAGQASAEAAGEASAQAAAGEAAQAAADAGERLQQARDGQPGQGEGQGQGQGQGQGEGQGSGEGQGRGQGSGQGQGQGSGQGQGQGQGSGQGQGQGQGAGGSPSGNVNGGGGSSAQGGQGGQGTGTGHTDGSGGPDTDTIFDPAHGTGGETGSVGGGTGSGQGGTIGTTDGQTNSGSANVPVSRVIDDYTRQATDAMNNPAVPPSIRALVLAYFNQLQGKN